MEKWGMGISRKLMGGRRQGRPSPTDTVETNDISLAAETIRSGGSLTSWSQLFRVRRRPGGEWGLADCSGPGGNGQWKWKQRSTGQGSEICPTTKQP
jgi:hypothetical protein